MENIINVVRSFFTALLGYVCGSSTAENAAQSAALETAAKADAVQGEFSALSGDAARNQLHNFDRE